MAKKILSFVTILLLIGGLSLSGYSIFNIWNDNQQTDKLLVEAEELLTYSSEEEVVIPKFQKGDPIGVLEVPKIDEKLPIVEGTDSEELRKGVGHYTGTALPNQNDQIVLSGHRDTLFRRFDEINIGDHFIVKLQYGEFTYEIVDTKIVDADDRTVIKSTAPEEILTVTTCYPFGYIGDAPERFIFTAKRVN
ncbi:class D sortase [Paucisalibacillus sp. EB02]|uniref:class D sortase n=1 Tax=Paucisalibacillus sp. EB02 TaxID=1347087 RepID=UPI0004BBC753|nr:class D sortase [Paucisalibacillus sp. EB02]